MKKKQIWYIVILIILVLIAIPIGHVLKTKWNETEQKEVLPKGYTNDASQLNLTKVDTIIKVPKSKSDIENNFVKF